jgi:hypothetical protein
MEHTSRQKDQELAHAMKEITVLRTEVEAFRNGLKETQSLPDKQRAEISTREQGLLLQGESLCSKKLDGEDVVAQLTRVYQLLEEERRKNKTREPKMTGERKCSPVKPT